MRTGTMVRVAALGAAGTLALACERFTAVVGPTEWQGAPRGDQVRPTPVTTAATSVFRASLHPTTKVVSYAFTWNGLSGLTTGVHLHGPADANAVAPVIVDFEALPAGATGSVIREANGSATGELDLTRTVTATISGDSLVKLLDAGLVYVDAHTDASPGGEIRGRITRR